MKSREEYYPYEGGGRFVEFLSPIEIKAVNRKKPHPRDIIYQPIPGPFRWAFAELVEGLHRTKDNFLECWDIANQQVYDYYSRAQVRISRLAHEIYIPG